MYFGGEANASPTVLIVQHAGSDSDKWLWHELDDAFRDEYGIPSLSYTPREVNGQTILVDSVGGRDYRWLSGNEEIRIEYNGSLRTLPEPSEVVQAYLVTHPSTLSALSLQELRNTANKTAWIKDEMARRLWLCDKWIMQLQLGKKSHREVVAEVVKNITIFLNYREKYFRKFGLLKSKADDEKRLLYNLQSQQNTTTLKEKLEEYNKWWSDNKNNSLSF